MMDVRDSAHRVALQVWWYYMKESSRICSCFVATLRTSLAVE